MVMSIVDAFKNKLYEPAPASFIGWTRIVILFFLLYKFLSRDYSLFGTLPETLALAYPANVFHPLDAYVLFGFKYIVDFCTFHWIHWFIAFPSELTLYYIQRFLEFMLVFSLFFGGGYKKVNYLIIYVLGMYLLGFLFRMGSDIDEIFVQMQIVLLLFLFRGKESYILFFKQQNPLNYSKENGWFFSMVLLIFIAYYFLAGINKIIDISLLDWGRYELANLAELNKLKIELGDDRGYCYIRELFIGNSWMDIPGTILVYLEHLLIPLLFFRREYIPVAWFIYILFHLSALSINLFFTGVFLSWLVFLPMHRMYQKVIVLWDGDCTFCYKSVLIAKKFDWFNRFVIINSNDKHQHKKYLEGWDGDIEKGLWAKGLDSMENHVGFDGFRRMVWVMPLFWIILPLLYLPLIPTIGRIFYAWIAKNRYKFGCNSDACTV
ncbi:MAG: Unknown protein [uncultured Sulfurovum sp.]|uniref:HTTM domain-containing protein n=1 Tax=uncultured Sulfurovum sp. TaxID=269237 RepID=A0A6S6TMF8_9BACT|nr:MAG: Unknown protein [uncultured Sulfurovum sp.]